MSFNVKPGMFVMMVSKDPKSTYSNGEYVVLTVGAASKSFTAVKPQIGYEGHTTRTFYEAEWECADYYEDDEALKNFITNQLYWSDAPKRGDKLSWIESVYTGAGSSARLLARAYEKKTGCKIPICGESGVAPSADSAEVVVLLRKLCAHLGVK